MTSLLRLILVALVGLTLAGYGVFHSVERYPGPEVFHRFADALPLLQTVLSFWAGVLGVISGITLLSVAVYRLRRRRRPSKLGAQVYTPALIPPPVRSRPAPSYRDELHAEGFDEEPEHYDTFSRSRDNGRLDRRQGAGSYR